MPEVIHTRVLQLADVWEKQIYARMVVQKESLLRRVRLAGHDMVNLPVRRAHHLMASRCKSLQEKAEDASAAAPVADLDLTPPIVQDHHGALEVPLELLHLRRRDFGHDLLGQLEAESRGILGAGGSVRLGVLRFAFGEFYVFLCFSFCFR